MSKKTQYRAAENEYFHVYSRGARRSNIFDSRANYFFFLSKVDKLFVQSEIRIICFCLMPNHFHFVIQQLVQDGISSLMTQLGNSYAKAINKQRGMTGHVFESKYKIELIDSESYLLWLSRYVHRNPREAELVHLCSEWEFSSFRDFIGTKRYGFLYPSVILTQFRSADDYRRYVEDATDIAPPGVERYLFPE